MRENPESEISEELFAGMRHVLAAEATTAQRYTYFSQVAEIEGHLTIAKLFAELARSIDCAAHGHLDVLRDVADPMTRQPLGHTELNLAAALTGELEQATETYPALAALCHREGVADTASWLETMAALKRVHVEKLRQALDGLKSESNWQTQDEP